LDFSDELDAIKTFKSPSEDNFSEEGKFEDLGDPFDSQKSPSKWKK